VERSQIVVLIVDDDATVRNFLAIIIQERGYSFLVASNGQEALTLSRTYRGDIHLLLSDVNMPQMSGPDLARHVMSERPGIRVLIMSGIEQTNLNVPFLRKPFVPHELWGKLEQVFRDHPAARRKALSW
jgi:DNA-binding NtrC family response regulator